MLFNIASLDIFLLILVRISTFMFLAPFFSLKNIPQKIKIGISLFLAIIIFNIISKQTVVYNGVMEFGFMLVKEALVGLIIGFFSNLAYHIIAFAGQFIDNQVGFSMVNDFDPILQVQTTITANYYSYFIMLMLFVTNLHHYILVALVDTFTILPLGQGTVNSEFYKLILVFLQDFFVIGLRIVLPIFATSLIVNAVLGILTKAAPQINMFVVGFQLKIIVGLLVLLVLAVFLPHISTLIFDEMIIMMKAAIEGLL